MSGRDSKQMCYIKAMKKNKILLITLISFSVVAATLLTFLVLYRTGVWKGFSFGKGPEFKKTDVGELIAYEYDPDTALQNLVMVNKDHPIDPDFPANISEYKDTDVLMNSEIIDSYAQLSQYIRENMGQKLYVSSSYRSYDDQERVYQEEGPDIAAYPGQSEHQTGLALDIYIMYHAGMAFIDSEVGRFVNDHCSEFGFIIRYPDGKQDITGFEFEPWHIRYVGQPHASIIMQNDLTLEEYFDGFEIGSWYSYDHYLISRQPLDDIKIPAANSGDGISVSPDNLGYVFITIDVG